jgi:hypothetical protein
VFFRQSTRAAAECQAYLHEFERERETLEPYWKRPTHRARSVPSPALSIRPFEGICGAATALWHFNRSCLRLNQLQARSWRQTRPNGSDQRAQSLSWRLPHAKRPRPKAGSFKRRYVEMRDPARSADTSRRRNPIGNWTCGPVVDDGEVAAHRSSSVRSSLTQKCGMSRSNNKMPQISHRGRGSVSGSVGIVDVKQSSIGRIEQVG